MEAFEIEQSLQAKCQLEDQRGGSDRISRQASEKMKYSIFLITLCTFVQWNTAHACCNCYSEMFPKSCNSLEPHAVSGVYKIQPLQNADPIMVYCEMAGEIIKGNRAYNFLPRSITRRPDAQKIVNALFRDRKNVLLKLQKKVGLPESYTEIQPHPSFANVDFRVLMNSFSGYTEPKNSFMKDYILFGITPNERAKSRSIQGFKSNGATIQFRNCDANPNSLFAFMPNHDNQAPSNYHPNLVYENAGFAVNWRSKAKPITNPDRMMPNEFFFFTELHFGGCGCYTSSNRWRKFGYRATAIGIR
ncbi:hypothetical protein OS493_007125 [Desmophyllum pertusum]|uniref:Uncharacterized protein n=1 Tax=Desmophyllum pertusum TaxID=174260 RepID=A0A9W9ZFZ6_9CNID|nr:hypothetical protein OS493_007125 [Desmophyllum pertusum]